MTALPHPLLPLFAMVALTAAVWVRLLLDRVGEIRERRIPLSEIATARQLSAMLVRTNASDNLKNLFELPVLFYVLCLTLYVTHQFSGAFVIAAWAYVALRAAHSYIHCTYNDVMHRFRAYWTSSALLWAMWATFGWSLFSQGVIA